MAAYHGEQNTSHWYKQRGETNSLLWEKNETETISFLMGNTSTKGQHIHEGAKLVAKKMGPELVKLVKKLLSKVAKRIAKKVVRRLMKRLLGMAKHLKKAVSLSRRRESSRRNSR